MSIFGRLFRARDKPVSNSLPGSAFSFFFGGTAAGQAVNERSAMQMSAVYACVRILSEAIAALPLHFYEYNEKGGKEKALDHPLYVILHDEPNPEMSAFSFRETLMTHLLLWGNAYAQIIRNGRGEVLALYPLMPDRMLVDRDARGRIYSNTPARMPMPRPSERNPLCCYCRRMFFIFRAWALMAWWVIPR